MCVVGRNMQTTREGKANKRRWSLFTPTTLEKREKVATKILNIGVEQYMYPLDVVQALNQTVPSPPPCIATGHETPIRAVGGHYTHVPLVEVVTIHRFSIGGHYTPWVKKFSKKNFPKIFSAPTAPFILFDLTTYGAKVQ